MALNDVELPGTDTPVDTFTLFSNEPIDETAKLSRIGLEYGKVAFPVTNEFLYYDTATRLFVARRAARTSGSRSCTTSMRSTGRA